MTDRSLYKPKGELVALPCLPSLTIKVLGILCRGKSTWEFGSGGSTLWFAKHAKSVVSIEDDPDWYNAVREALWSNALEADVRLVKTEALPDAIVGEGLYDVIFVDCLTQNERRRSVILGAKHVKPKGWLIADDYDFPLTKAAVNSLRADSWEVSVISGIKLHPIRNVPVSTSTAFCYNLGK